MANDDLKQHVTSSHDFYDLLSVSPAAAESEIRRAYRKTALKYHPDKVGNDTAALEKFHLLQIAYDVLSTPEIREQYDNHRRAKEQAKARTEQLSAQRGAMKADLERREAEGLKRKRGEAEGDAAWEREVERIREDNKRRRVELEERRRQEQLARDGPAASDSQNDAAQSQGEVPEVQRAVKVRCAGDRYTRESLQELFSRFGEVEMVVIRPRSLKKKPGSGMVVFKSVVFAHAAVVDFPKLAVNDPDRWGGIEDVEWAEGKAPEFVPKSTSREPAGPASTQSSDAHSNGNGSQNGKDPPKPTAPKFSFKKSESAGGTASLDEITLMRLKNAEKRRLEKQQAAAAEVT